MTEHAIVAGSLTDVRNIGTDKSVKLTIHVPVELAMTVFKAFGWPSSVDPVPVVVARVQDGTVHIEEPSPGEFVEVER